MSLVDTRLDGIMKGGNDYFAYLTNTELGRIMQIFPEIVMPLCSRIMVATEIWDAEHFVSAGYLECSPFGLST